MDIREADDEMLIEALADRGIDVRHIKDFSDTELNNELTRRKHEAKKVLDKALKEAKERVK